VVTNERNHVTEATAITPGEVYRQAREQAAQDGDYDVQRGLDRFSAWLENEPTDEADSYSRDSQTWSASSRERPANADRASSRPSGKEAASDPAKSGIAAPHDDADASVADPLDEWREAMAATNKWFSGRTSSSRLSADAERRSPHAGPVLAGQGNAGAYLRLHAGSSTSRPGRKSSRRQARLALLRIEPWPVMKISFIASTAAVVALFTAVEDMVTTITSSKASSWFSESRVLGFTGMFGALSIVLITAGSTIGAVIYNLVARAIGGIKVTLQETD
jgi:hypothetical protein